jgi:hypothetical protein
LQNSLSAESFLIHFHPQILDKFPHRSNGYWVILVFVMDKNLGFKVLT